MKNRFFSCCLAVSATLLASLLALTQVSEAQAAKARMDPATVTLVTDLRRSTDAGSQVIATLAVGQEVKVLGMQGALARVDADGKVGWMPASKLRIGTGGSLESSQESSQESTQESANSGSSFLRGLSGILGGGSQPDSGAKVPIGVRGLQKKDLASAEPDPAAVDRMESFKASSGDGQAHARAAGLQSHAIEYRKVAVGSTSSGGAVTAPRGADN